MFTYTTTFFSLYNKVVNDVTCNLCT